MPVKSTGLTEVGVCWLSQMCVIQLGIQIPA